MPVPARLFPSRHHQRPLEGLQFQNVAKPDLMEHVKDIVLSNVTVNGAVINQTFTDDAKFERKRSAL